MTFDELLEIPVETDMHHTISVMRQSHAMWVCRLNGVFIAEGPYHKMLPYAQQLEVALKTFQDGISVK